MAWSAEEILVKAGADLSAKQFYWVMLEADGDANLATAQTANLGPLQNMPESGEDCNITPIGQIGQAKVGGTVAAGDVGMVDTGDGMVKKATDDKVVVCTFLEAGVDGDTIRVLVLNPHLCADVSDEGVAN